MHSRLLVLAFCAVIFSGVQATNSPPELEGVLDDVMTWLDGSFSSRPQLALEEKYGAPPDGVHYDWYRVFAKVDVPHIGDNVIYGQLHMGSPDAPIVPGTQILYISTIDEAKGAVSMSGRRIANPGDYEDAHLDPEKLKTIAIDPEYGGNCDFRWRRHGKQVVGRLAQPDEDFIDGTCSMTSKKSGLTMTWDAEWVLNEDELWIYDNGYIDGTDLFQGREDRTHVRLTRVRKFECQVGDQSVVLHDGRRVRGIGAGRATEAGAHRSHPRTRASGRRRSRARHGCSGG